MLVGSKAIGTCAVMGGVPAVLSKFAWSLTRLMIFSREACCGPAEHIHFDVAEFSDHAPARNSLAGKFLGDWILMLDADHEFEPDLLARLLEKAKTPGVDVLSGLYRFKSPPYSPVLFSWCDDEKLRPISSWLPKNVALFQIGSAGAGCLLIKRHVLDAIWASGEQPFDRIFPHSEDHSFFLRLKRLGISSWCAPAIEAGHLRTMPVTEEDYDYSGFSEAAAEPACAFV